VGWADLTLDAGLLIGLAGVVLIVRQVARRLREPTQEGTARYVEGIGDLASLTVLFGGWVVMLFGSFAEHVSDEMLPSHLRLSLFGGMGILLLFGFQLGRLFMRWQVQRLLTELDAEMEVPNGLG
jgi:hypothetical protein